MLSRLLRTSPNLSRHHFRVTLTFHHVCSPTCNARTSRAHSSSASSNAQHEPASWNAAAASSRREKESRSSNIIIASDRFEATREFKIVPSDVLSVLRIMLQNGVIGAVVGVLASRGFFAVARYFAIHVNPFLSVTITVISAVVYCGMGLYRGLGSILVYFAVDKGAISTLVRKLAPEDVLGAASFSIEKWNSFVAKLCGGIKSKMNKAGAIGAGVGSLLTRNLSWYLRLGGAPDPEKMRESSLEDVISRKFEHVVRAQTNRPFYIAAGLYVVSLGFVACYGLISSHK